MTRRFAIVLVSVLALAVAAFGQEAAPPPTAAAIDPLALEVASHPQPVADALVAAFAAAPGKGDLVLFAMSSRSPSKKPYTALLAVAKVRDTLAGASLAGEVRAAGQTVGRFGIPAGDPLEIGGEFSRGRSIALAPGSYDIAVAVVAADGSVRTTAATKTTVPDIAAEGWTVSDLILSRTFVTMDTPQHETEPFAFSGVRIYPDAFATFGPTDSLSYFIAIDGPSVDAATGQPALESMFVMTAEGRDKPSLKTPLAAATGVTQIHPEAWAIGSEIPLGQLPFMTNGRWTFEVRLKDTVTGLIEKRSATFTFAGGKDPEPLLTKAEPPKKSGGKKK